MSYLGNIYIYNLFVVYLKFKFSWPSVFNPHSFCIQPCFLAWIKCHLTRRGRHTFPLSDHNVFMSLHNHVFRNTKSFLPLVFHSTFQSTCVVLASTHVLEIAMLLKWMFHNLSKIDASILLIMLLIKSTN